MEFLGRQGLVRLKNFPQAERSNKQDFSLPEYGTIDEKRFVKLNEPDENKE